MYGKPMVARMSASEAKKHRGKTAGESDADGYRALIGMDEADEWLDAIDAVAENKERKELEWKQLNAPSRSSKRPPRARLRAGTSLLPGPEAEEMELKEEWEFAMELTRTYADAARRGAEQMVSAVYQHNAEEDHEIAHAAHAKAKANAGGAAQQVLPHGWWRLDVTVVAARDMHRQEAGTARGKPLVNPYVEMEVCGQMHRTQMVPDSDLRTIEVRGTVHDTVAKFNSTASFTIDDRWYGQDFVLRLFHWRPVNIFKNNTAEYSDFDAWGVPHKDGKGHPLNHRLRKQLADEVNLHARPKLLGEIRQSLEWYREGVKSGWFNVFLNGSHVSNGALDTSVSLRFEPSVPRPETAAELRGFVGRRVDMLKHRARIYTPIPHASPFFPRLSSSRAGPRRSRTPTPGAMRAPGMESPPASFGPDGRPRAATPNIYTLHEGREAEVLRLDQDTEGEGEGGTGVTNGGHDEERGGDAGPVMEAASSQSEDGGRQVSITEQEQSSVGMDSCQVAVSQAGSEEGGRGEGSEVVATSEDGSSKDASSQRPSTRGSRKREGKRPGTNETAGGAGAELVEVLVEKSGGGEGGDWCEGVVWYLGTEGGSTEFQNPADSGLVRVSTSSPWSRGRAENVTGRAGLPSHSDREQDSWVCIELPKRVSLVPSGYAVRHGLQGSGRVLTDWTLMGSRDGLSWLPLKTHRQDLTLAAQVREAEGRARMSGSKFVSGYEHACFPIADDIVVPTGVLVDADTVAEAEEEREANARLKEQLEAMGGVRFLQLQSTGPDSSGLWTLACSGLEFFGRLLVDQRSLVADVSAQRGASHRRTLSIRVLRSLGVPGDESVVRVLYDAYVEDDDAVSAVAADALRRLGNAPTIDHRLDGGSLTVCQGDCIDGLVATFVSGSPPLQLSVSPALPRGMELDPVTGEVYGTALRPAERGSYAITAHNLAGTAVTHVEICVLPKALPVGATFEFSSDFDQFGLLHFLSTAGGRLPWTNPAQSGMVSLESSGWLTDLHYVVGDGGRISTSFTKQDSWFSLQLPPGVWVAPTRYSLRHGFSSSSHALRSWDLLGSVDGREWHILRSHRDDQTLDGRFAEATWAIGGGGRAVRWFKVAITGASSSHAFELRCAGFEVYGEVFVDLPVAATHSDTWFRRKWGVEAMVMAVAQALAETSVVNAEGGAGEGETEQRGGENRRATDSGGGHALDPERWQEALEMLDGQVGLECGGFVERLVELCADDDLEVQLVALSVLPLFACRGDQGAIRAGFAGLGSEQRVVREASTVLLESVAEPGDRATFAAALDLVIDAIVTARRPTHARRRGSARVTAAASTQHSVAGLAGVVIPPVPVGRPFRGGGAPQAAASTRRKSDAGLSVAAGADVSAYVRGLGLVVGEEDGGALLAMLQCCQRAVRGEGTEGEWQDTMLPHLAKPMWYLRSSIARLLPCVAKRGDDQATTAALTLLRDTEASVRAQAAQTLGRIARAGDSRIVMKLQQRLGDPDPHVRATVAQTLGQLSGFDPVGQAIDTITLADIGVDPSVRPRVDSKARALLRDMGGAMPGQEGRRKSIDSMSGRAAVRPGTGAQTASVEAFLQMHTHPVRPHIPPWANGSREYDLPEK